MKLSAFADVCLRILMHIADREERLTTQEIADQIGVPYNHVTKAVLELRRLGAIEVIRGRAGGTTITEKGQNYSVGELLRQLDPREDVVDCTSTNHTCPLIGRCKLRAALRKARDAFYEELTSLKVKDLIGEGDSMILLPMPAVKPHN